MQYSFHYDVPVWENTRPFKLVAMVVYMVIILWHHYDSLCH